MWALPLQNAFYFVSKKCIQNTKTRGQFVVQGIVLLFTLSIAFSCVHPLQMAVFSSVPYNTFYNFLKQCATNRSCHEYT